MGDSLRHSVVTIHEPISCDSMVAKLVQSSNAIALAHFGKELIKSRIAAMTSDKATINLYVINDISETPAEQRLVEHAVVWLEFYRQTGELLDITNDPEKPEILHYDKTILEAYDLFKICSTELDVAKPGAMPFPKSIPLS